MESDYGVPYVYDLYENYDYEVIDLTGEDNECNLDNYSRYDEIIDLTNDDSYEDDIIECTSNPNQDIRASLPLNPLKPLSSQKTNQCVLNTTNSEKSFVSRRKGKKRKKSRNDHSTKNQNTENDSQPIKRSSVTRSDDSLTKFYSIILNWSIEALKENKREALLLPNLKQYPARFDSKEHYMSFVSEIPIEESRVCIYSGLKKPQSKLSLEIEPFIVHTVYGVNTLKFEVKQGFFDPTKTGSVFSLKCNSLTGLQTLAAVSQTNLPYGKNRKTYLHLWVSTDWLLSVKDTTLFLNTQTWTAEYICSVLSYQRMYVGCFNLLSVSFMSQLLGNKLSSHIRFDTLSDSEWNNTIIDPTSSSCNTSFFNFQINQNHPKRSNKTDILTAIKKDLNPSQVNAFENCLQGVLHRGYDMSPGSIKIVHGPPGCGKTFFLVQLIAGMLSQGLVVMVCAPSNKAICVILEQFLKSPHYAKEDHLACLVGVEDKLNASSESVVSPTSLPESTVQSGDSLLPPGLASAIAQVLRPAYALDLLVYKFVDMLSHCFKSMKTYLNEWLLLFLTKKELNDYKIELAKLSAFLKEYIAVFRKLERILSSSPMQFAFECFYAESEEHVESLESMITLRDNTEPIELEAMKTMVHDSCWSLNTLMNSTLEILEDPETKHAMSQAAVRSSNLIFSTLISAGRGILSKNAPLIDVLVCDEAAQALECETLVPLSLKPKHLILVGDPMQLPATVMSQEISAQGIEISMMERLLRVQNGITASLLSTQYRMHPEISLFPNQAYYDGKLQNSNSVTERPNPLMKNIHKRVLKSSPRAELGHDDNLLKNFSFFDVPGQEEYDSCQSIRNRTEARFIVKLISYLLRVYALDKGISHRHICVITFYSSQVGCIQSALCSSGFENIRVMTVDSFQGSEADCVILSFVRSNPRSNVGFVNSKKRLNVALTRARHLLLAVGCVKTLTNQRISESGGNVNALVQDALRRNRVFRENSIY